MRFLALDTTDSTSARASDLLRNESESPPFAIFASAQTSGRGRGGNTWSSVPGNIHLTIALPPPSDSDPTLMPLKAAVIVARWLAERHHTRATIKWPNDLLFAGRKLGGILCEAHYRGSECVAILVGIGLNVASAPMIGDTSNAAVALREIRPTHEDAVDLARALCEFWERTSPTLTNETIVSEYHSFAIEPGHHWTDQSGERWIGRGIAPDGALMVGRENAARGDVPISVHDASRGWRWIYGGDTPSASLIVADTGNTATKFAIYATARATTPSHTATFVNNSVDEAAIRDFARHVPARREGERPTIHWSSVFPGAFERLAGLARTVGFDVAPLPKRPVLRYGDGYSLQDLGIDRLAIIESHLASRRHERKLVRDHITVLVSAGTATTIDVVRDDGEHLGGLIIPGIQTALDSLHLRGAQLPPLNAHAAVALGDGLGHGTPEAIHRGALQMTLGAIDRAITLATHGGNSTASLVVTGGFASEIARAYSFAVERPNMALDGIRIMAIGG